MKIAISIPEPIFKAADRLAKRLDLSRSELYACAISVFVEENRGQKVTDMVNLVYEEIETNELEPCLNEAQIKSISNDSW